MSIRSSLRQIPWVQSMRGAWHDWTDGGFQRSYAQEGEDLILARYFEHAPAGFYVDVGAHDPRRFSNTLLLSRRGWRGINIDATPGSMDRFRRLRPRDVNLECAVGQVAGTVTLYRFDEPALNTLDAGLVPLYEAHGYRVVATESIAMRPLADILSEHMGQGQSIQLLSVDVEGHDLQVLKSNDWARFRPQVLVVESLKDAPQQSEDMAAFLTRQGYRWFAQTVNSRFYEAGHAA